MQKYLFILICLIIGSNGIAQKWVKINQDYFGMKYKLPKGWVIDGFGGDNWEENGSSVCDCAGTINIGNRDETNEIYMVIYPSRDKDSIVNTKRNRVWDMEFINVENSSRIKTKYCSFEKKVSKWNENIEGSFKGDEVWQLKTNNEKQYYVLYFWAKPNVIKENENLLIQIINSFQPVNVN